MKDVIRKIKTSTAEYPFVFNLNIVDLIQDKYGSLEKWADLIEGKIRNDKGDVIERVTPSIKDIKWFFKESVNEGIDIDNENSENKRSFITEKQAGRIITEMGIEEAAEKIAGLTKDSVLTDRQIEEQKNV